MNKIKLLTWHKLNIYLLNIYIITLFVFVYDVKLVKLSEFVLILLFSVTLINISRNHKIQFSRLFIPIILLIFFGTLSILWSIDKYLALKRIITLYQLALLIFIVFQTIENEDDIMSSIYSIAIGGIGMTLYSVWFYGYVNIANALTQGIRLGGDITQENVFGYFSALTVVLLFQFFLYMRNKKLLFISIVPMIFVFTSGSRRSLLIVLAGIILSILLYSKSKKNKIKVLLTILIIIIISPIVLNLIGQIDLFYRFNYMINFLVGIGEVDNSLLTRNRLITFGFNLFKERPIFGYGIYQFRVIHQMNYGRLMSAHNGYINILVEFGAIGFILYYGMFFRLLSVLWSSLKFKINIISSSLFILLILQLISDTATITFWDKFTYILLGLSYAYIRILNSNKKA